jgi:hypothetical protein
MQYTYDKKKPFTTFLSMLNSSLKKGGPSYQAADTITTDDRS